MKKLLLLTLMIATLASFKANNTRHITGTVFEYFDKAPIAGIFVKVEGGADSVQTNSNGEYAIDVPDGKKTLIFSLYGYLTQKINIGKATKINVYLHMDPNILRGPIITENNLDGKLLSPPPSKKEPYMMNNRKPGRGLATSGGKGYYPSPPIGYYSKPANEESYKRTEENKFLSPKYDPLSTFSIDIDAASYTNVRRFINEGQLPPADAVRVEEMINYFKYDLPGPKGNDPVAIHTELSSAPWNTKDLLLRIGLKARTIDMDRLPPSNLVFLLDISGSMADENKLPLIKSAMKILVDQLRPQDRVAIVVYSGEAGLKLASTPGNKKTVIKNAIDELSAGGSTAGGAGIKMAYRIARENFMKNGNNRIIMATDGDFNIDDSSDGDMEDLITRERSSNVPITIMGVGMGNLKDSKMETMADKGNGNYAYIDNLTQARKTLITEFGGTMFMVAKDVKLQVEFNPANVKAYRLVGYEDRMLAKEDFNNDKKDAGDMGSGHTVTAFYEIIPIDVTDDEYTETVDPLEYQKAVYVKPTDADELMNIKFRYKQPGSDQSKMSMVTVKNKAEDFKKTSSDFRFATAVAEFGMLLHNSSFKQKSDYDQVISIAKEAKGQDDDGYRAEFIRLAESAKSLAGNQKKLEE